MPEMFYFGIKKGRYGFYKWKRLNLMSNQSNLIKMKRKEFLKTSAITALGVSFFTKTISGSRSLKDLSIETADDLHKYMRSMVEVDEPSVDKIIIGEPNTRIKKIGTCWMPYWNTLKEAKSKGINTIVTHEPTFYSHHDLFDSSWINISSHNHGKKEYLKLLNEKKEWILKNKMVIIRNHDVMDKISKIGMPYALGAVLGFTDNDIKERETYFNVYNTPKRKAIDIAKEFADKLKPLNQPGVAFYGDENYMVSSVGVGTGCICDPMLFAHLNPDMNIAISDTVRTWIQTTYARDSGKPLLIIDHGTSEEHGMKLLGGFLNEQLPELEVLHLPQGCTYKWIT